MSVHHNRPERISEASITEANLELAATHVPHQIRCHEQSVAAGAAAGAFVAALVSVAGGSGPVTATAAVVAAVATAVAASHKFTRRTSLNRARWAQAVGYLEELRGKNISTAILKWADFYDLSVTDLAEDVETICAHIGADRTHQLMVRAQQGRDYGLFRRLINAGLKVTDNGLETDEDLACNYIDVVDTLLATREQIGNVAALHQLLLKEAVRVEA